jgi:hypothetical protein
MKKVVTTPAVTVRMQDEASASLSYLHEKWSLQGLLSEHEGAPKIGFTGGVTAVDKLNVDGFTISLGAPAIGANSTESVRASDRSM